MSFSAQFLALFAYLILNTVNNNVCGAEEQQELIEWDSNKGTGRYVDVAFPHVGSEGLPSAAAAVGDAGGARGRDAFSGARLLSTCNMGYYYDDDARRCFQCPSGQYKDGMNAATTCDSCLELEGRECDVGQYKWRCGWYTSTNYGGAGCVGSAPMPRRGRRTPRRGG